MNFPTPAPSVRDMLAENDSLRLRSYHPSAPLPPLPALLALTAVARTARTTLFPPTQLLDWKRLTASPQSRNRQIANHRAQSDDCGSVTACRSQNPPDHERETVFPALTERSFPLVGVF